MTSTTDWRRLKELAEERRDRMAQRLAEAAARRDAARQKLELLVDYRRDYDARLAQSAGAGIDAAKLRSYRSFLANLEQAIAQQADVLAAAQQHVAAAEAEWRVEQRQVDSFRVLDERRAASAVRAAARTEQKLIDEIATRTLSPSVRGGSDD